VDAEVERAKRAYASRGGVEDAARARTAVLRARGVAGACAWVRAQVGPERARLVHEEAARLARALERALDGEDPATLEDERGDGVVGLARLADLVVTLDRVVAGEWPEGVEPAAVAAALDAWRRMLPLVLTERIVSGGLFLAGTVGRGRPRVERTREGFQRRLARVLCDLADRVDEAGGGGERVRRRA
jgi:hypothetical protein